MLSKTRVFTFFMIALMSFVMVASGQGDDKFTPVTVETGDGALFDLIVITGVEEYKDFTPDNGIYALVGGVVTNLTESRLCLNDTVFKLRVGEIVFRPVYAEAIFLSLEMKDSSFSVNYAGDTVCIEPEETIGVLSMFDVPPIADSAAIILKDAETELTAEWELEDNTVLPFSNGWTGR
jgi:hypothetical protein